MSALKVIILGCGNSTGVPAIGNYWGACDPEEPKNRRSRSSILVQTANTNVVVDTGPDFREQLNRADVRLLDAALYTHAHGDHINGIDELRIMAYRNKKLVPVYGNKATLDELTQRFSYLFEGGESDLYPPVVQPVVIGPEAFGQEHKIGDLEFVPFDQDHGSCCTVGYRFGDFGYSVDILDLDDDAVEALRGVKTWVVDCAGYRDAGNPVHAHLETVCRLHESIGAAQTYLTSLTLAMDYKTLLGELPKEIQPAYDGLVLEF